MGEPENYSLREKLTIFWERCFPERQFYYRSRGNVRYISVKGLTQSLVLTSATGFVGWVIFASVFLVFKNDIIASKNEQISDIQANYDDLASRLINAEDRFSALTSEIEAKHKQLVMIVTQNAELEKRLGLLNRELKKVSSARDDALSTKAKLARQVARLDADIRSTSQNNNSLEKAMQGALGKIGALTKERNNALQTSDALGLHVDRLEVRLSDIKSSQQNLITRLHERTALNVAEMEEMILITGIDLAGLVKKANPRAVAQGGPLVKLKADEEFSFVGMNTGFENSVTALEAHLGRWEGLQNIVQSIPLAAPADSYYLSSGYGRRKDPFTKRWASHHGLDFAGHFKTRIRATAAGKVTFAGNNGPYGKMIEIDHGLGIKTRYGHLHRILVKKGQSVDFRDKIGLMGSTGRSTGHHVHYEVIYNGKTLDPAKFLKAGRYVFKNG
ncbi:MAG: peptidoglycan DD-metalloendopeptidase family protein [Alphaproteobacteria bacterium]|nr:peptidoglycan DD-metalloendopeptidase family protein [Alphaproteobacteria bacterium]MBT4967197.1 peptidoglycan DD-metalloendopeptidase family protein [Alphaproteobacteria bacterium]MBT5159935.1 peptidoglycan DD-metalloendopeptidase family protein [Alphaproteobacteria bacterium]